MTTTLKEKFNVILEHGTDVPGLADGLKHLDGFISLTEKLGFLFYKKSFSATRSAINGHLDPIQSLGLDKAVKELSYEASSILKSTKHLNFTADFNYFITGSYDVTEAASVMKKTGLEGLLDGILERLNTIIKENVVSGTVSENTNKQPLEIILDSGINTIVIKLFVKRMDVIGQLCTSNQNFIKTCKKNFIAVSKGQLDLNVKSIVMHFRLGDTAVFPLPNGKFIAAWGDWRKNPNKTSVPELLDSPDDAVYKPVNFSNTVSALQSATKGSEQPFYITLLSDGYDRGIDRISEFKSQLNLNDSDIEYIKKWAESEKNFFIEFFKSSMTAKNATINIFWGENASSFMESVKSIATADILFVGVGGFSKAIFNIYNLKDNAIILGFPKEKDTLWLERKVQNIFCN